MKSDMIVQIYEIQTPKEADLMIELGVDHVGSVLVSQAHWRDAALQQAIAQVRQGGRKSSLIPLFGDIDTISNAIDYYQPDIVHLCESLPPILENSERLDEIVAVQQAIRENYPEIEMMRSIPIGRQGQGDLVPSLAFADMFEAMSDWFLTDTLISNGDGPDDKDQPVTGYVGITGKTCDWGVARELVRRSRIPVILAGGIGPENVSKGISAVQPAGVDSCTLTNAVDPQGKALRFKKDSEKVRQLIQQARKPAGDN